MRTAQRNKATGRGARNLEHFECCSRCLLLSLLLALGAGWRLLGPMRGPIDGSFVITRLHTTSKMRTAQRNKATGRGARDLEQLELPSSRELRERELESESECCCTRCLLLSLLLASCLFWVRLPVNGTMPLTAVQTPLPRTRVPPRGSPLSTPSVLYH